MNYSSATNYNQMINSNGLQFTNNTAFWNATDEDLNNVRTKSQFIQSSVNNTKPSPSSIITAKYRNEEMGEISSSVAKKDKIETPSPLPTFKVRKEKMGDKITALQQLVSPFGKTDTASVLHEAIEYIKFLHDQVSVLSSPYMKNGSPPLQREIKDQEGLNIVQGLKSRGLCLVPVSSTFSVTSDQASTDFWTPTFGGSFSYRGRTPVPPLLNCYCHETTSLKTCWKGDNAGRRFRSCDNYKEGNSCGFSVWVDPPMCEQSKLIILGLLRRLDKIEAEKAALHGKKEAMEQKEGVAKKMFRILVACLGLS